MQERAREIAVRQLERPAVLGVDPSLILVFELAAPIDPDEFRRAGLRVLDGSDRRAVVAFADDPSLAAFNERLDALQAGPPEGRKSEPYASFFDSIDALRTLEPADRITAELEAALDAAQSGEVLRLDVECWHPDDRSIADDWLGQLGHAVENAGGYVADRYVNDRAGLLLGRVYVPAIRVRELSALDFVARIDVLPAPSISLPQLYQADPDSLPVVEPPRSDAPIVGIVDSGVRSAHPLLAGAIIAADGLGTGIDEGEDEHGHGTMVAALVLHGPVNTAIARGLPLRPLCRIVSARVLNRDNRFPDEDVWERDLEAAVRWCAEQGASIVNLSVGNSHTRLSTARQTGGAAIVDDLARQYGLVIVTCTGNIAPRDYLEHVDEAAAVNYPQHLLAASDAQLIDPASAALSITVGGITTAAAATGLSARETVLRIPMGKPGWPSPFTRIGPGLGASIKPEVVAHAGTLGIEHNFLVGNDPELGVISASANVGRLLSFDIGTSFAAPLVTRVAAAVKARFPDFSSNLIRALVLSSAHEPDFGTELVVDRPSDRDYAVRALLGYGRPSIARATESTSHRAVLVAQDAIPINGVHIYELPVPGSFFESGGQRGIDVALAYDPRTRARRLDYLSSRMEFHIVRGLPLDQVVEVFAKLEDDEMLDEGESSDEDDEPAIAGRPPTPSELGSQLCKLSPTSSIRSRGANQMGRVTFSQRLNPDRHSPMYLVVRDINQWEDPTASQTYALAAVMWRTQEQSALYNELEARLEAVIELPVEIELSA